MGCTKVIDFAPPPATGAHITYYWTMDEAGDLNKVDSAAAHAWPTAGGTSSPAGLFSNGVQLDCGFVGGFPFFHGLQDANDPLQPNLYDTALAFDATTSKGITVLFWAKQTVATSGSIFSPSIEWFLECTDPSTFINDAELLITWGSVPPSLDAGKLTLDHEDNTLSNSYVVDTPFAPVIGAWHMIVCTLDLVNHTLNIYIDSVLVATTPDVGNFYTSPAGYMLLRYNFGGGVNTGTVVIDEFMLSLKGAATQAQITAAYNGGAGVTWPAINTIFPYP